MNAWSEVSLGGMLYSDSSLQQRNKEMLNVIQMLKNHQVLFSNPTPGIKTPH